MLFSLTAATFRLGELTLPGADEYRGINAIGYSGYVLAMNTKCVETIVSEVITYFGSWLVADN